MKKNSRRKEYVQYLDYFAGTIVLLRDKTCIFCGRVATQGHHQFAKGQCQGVRFDIRGIIASCWACHQNKCHTNPEKYRDIAIAYIDKLYGKGAYERLKMKALLLTRKPDLVLNELLLIEDLKQFTTIPEDFVNWSFEKKKKWLKEKRQHIKSNL